MNILPTDFRSSAVSLFRGAVDFLYPPHCLVCGEELSGAPAAGVDLCSSCALPDPRQRLDDGIELCAVCFEATGLRQGSELDRCLACRLLEPPLKRIASLHPYDPGCASLLKALKYGRKWPLGRYLGRQMAAGLACSGLGAENPWDVVVPVPSPHRRLQHRGFNHTALIAAAFGREIGLPLSLSALQVGNDCKAQASLAPRQRAQNVRRAFTAAPSKVQGRRVLLLDDVVTSSASLSEAARALLRAGAAEIDAYTLARSPRFRYSRLSLLQEGSRNLDSGLD